MKKLIKISLSTITIFILLTGCSQKSAPDINMIKKYDKITKPVKINETRINIIRENTILGAAGSTYIECSNKIYALSSGSSMTCSTEEDINTINIMINDIPIYNLTSVVPVDNRLNEDVFLYLSPMKPIKEIDSDYGKTLIVDFNKPIKGKKENLLSYDPTLLTLMNPDLFLEFTPAFINDYIQIKDNDNIKKESINNYRFNKTLMKVDMIKTPMNSEESRVVLFRKADNGSSYLGIWTNDKFIGDLGVESFIDYRTQDNKLILHSYYHKWRTLEIPLEKGKTYYVNVDFDLGWNENTIEFLEVTEKDFNKSKYKLTKITLDIDKITSLMKKRLNKGLEKIKANLK